MAGDLHPSLGSTDRICGGFAAGLFQYRRSAAGSRDRRWLGQQNGAGRQTRTVAGRPVSGDLQDVFGSADRVAAAGNRQHPSPGNRQQDRVVDRRPPGGFARFPGGRRHGYAADRAHQPAVLVRSQQSFQKHVQTQETLRLTYLAASSSPGSPRIRIHNRGQQRTAYVLSYAESGIIFLVTR